MSERGKGADLAKPTLPEIRVVASPYIPPDSGVLITFRGRQPECRSHTAGIAHAPCWTFTRMDFKP